MEKDLKRASFIAFLASDLLKATFNPEDYQLVTSCISTQEQIKALAEKIDANGDDLMDQEAVLKAIKATDPRLSAIETLDARMKDFEDFISKIATNLDKDTLSDSIADFITPVLFHKNFIPTIDNLIGFLNEQDLTVMLDAFGQEDLPQKQKSS